MGKNNYVLLTCVSGNKVIMSLLQIVAARLANVDILFYHSYSKVFTEAYQQALKLLDTELVTQDTNLTEFLLHLEQKGFKWGMTDYN